MAFGRRGFLAAGGAALLTAAGRARARAQVDVAILGAGMAGLAAARGLLLEGRSVTLIEARDRIGGRAWTAPGSLGLPWDRGAAWLHAAANNPLTPVVQHLGFELSEEAARPGLYLDGDEATPRQVAHVEAAMDALARRAEAAAEAGRDSSVAVAAASVPASRWRDIAAAVMGPLEHGVALTDLSATDWYAQPDNAEEALLPAGLGTATAAFGQGLPVRLRTPAHGVGWGTDGVTVRTSAGDLEARAAILTVPTPVLASGLRFDPPLPGWKRAAIAALPLGAVEKVALRFDRDIFGLPPNSTAVLHEPGEPVIDVLVRPFGSDTAVALIGGSDARALARQAAEDRIGWLRAYFRRFLGRAVDDAFVAGDSTDWLGDLWAGGAYSARRPGQGGARAALARPLADRLFFAGEACDDVWPTQLPGAYRSGLRAASAVSRALG